MGVTNEFSLNWNEHVGVTNEFSLNWNEHVGEERLPFNNHIFIMTECGVWLNKEYPVKFQIPKCHEVSREYTFQIKIKI